jgi:DNA-binding transcriptional LysR family regulator
MSSISRPASGVERLTRGARPAFVSNLTLALVEAARAGAGIAVLPRDLDDVCPRWPTCAERARAESVFIGPTRGSAAP